MYGVLNAHTELLSVKHMTAGPKSAHFANVSATKLFPIPLWNGYAALAIQLNFPISVSWVKTNRSDNSVCF